MSESCVTRCLSCFVRCNGARRHNSFAFLSRLANFFHSKEQTCFWDRIQMIFEPQKESEGSNCPPFSHCIYAQWKVRLRSLQACKTDPSLEASMSHTWTSSSLRWVQSTQSDSALCIWCTWAAWRGQHLFESFSYFRRKSSEPQSCGSFDIYCRSNTDGFFPCRAQVNRRGL